MLVFGVADNVDGLVEDAGGILVEKGDQVDEWVVTALAGWSICSPRDFVAKCARLCPLAESDEASRLCTMATRKQTASQYSAYSLIVLLFSFYCCLFLYLQFDAISFDFVIILFLVLFHDNLEDAAAAMQRAIIAW